MFAVFELACSVMVKEWTDQHHQNIMARTVQETNHHLADVLRFILTFKRRRRAARQPLSLYCEAFIDTFRRAFVAWFARVADIYVLQTYLDSAVACDSPPISLSFRTPGKRKYVQVNPLAMWSVLQKMKATHSTGEQVLALRSDTDELGCSDRAADNWLLKLHEMYWKRCATVLSHGAGLAGPVRRGFVM